MKIRDGWHYIVVENGVVWVDGVKKRPGVLVDTIVARVGQNWRGMILWEDNAITIGVA